MRTVKIIPSFDCTSLDQAIRLLEAIADLDIVYGYKIGFGLGLSHGLPKTVEAIRSISQKPIIYDHQKAGTDIPDTGQLFAETLKNAGVNEAILFPQAGPATLRAWIQALQTCGIKVVVGGVMTHSQYLVSEGGFILDEGVNEIFSLSQKNGVNAFVVPLTKPAKTRQFIKTAGLGPDTEFYSPGFGTQGGNPAEFSFIQHHFLIIGRKLLAAQDPRQLLISLKEELK